MGYSVSDGKTETREKKDEKDGRGAREGGGEEELKRAKRWRGNKEKQEVRIVVNPR